MKNLKQIISSLSILLLLSACSDSKVSLFPDKIEATMLGNDSILDVVYNLAIKQFGESANSTYEMKVTMDKIVTDYMDQQRPYRSPLKIKIPRRIHYIIEEELSVQHPKKKLNWVLINTYTSKNPEWIASSDSVLTFGLRKSIDNDLFDFRKVKLEQIKDAVKKTLEKYSGDDGYKDLYVSKIVVRKTGIQITISRTTAENKDKQESTSYSLK